MDYHTTFAEENLFDIDPLLSLSVHSNNLLDGDESCFDFDLDDDAISKCSDDLEGILLGAGAESESTSKMSADDLDQMFIEEAAAFGPIQKPIKQQQQVVVQIQVQTAPPLPFNVQSAPPMTVSPVAFDSFQVEPKQEEVPMPIKIHQTQHPQPAPAPQLTTTAATTKIRTGYNCVRGRSRRPTPSPPKQQQQRIIVPTTVQKQKRKHDTINNKQHPAPYNHQKYQKEVKKKIRRSSCNDLNVMGGRSHDGRPQRRVTIDGMTPSLSVLLGQHQRGSFIESSSGSFGSLSSCDNNNNSPMHQHHPSLSALLGHSAPNMTQNDTTPQYPEALRKLIVSMKRTEVSRRQLLVQRTTHQMHRQQLGHAAQMQRQQLGHAAQMHSQSQQGVQQGSSSSISFHSAQQLQQRVADSGLFARQRCSFQETPFTYHPPSSASTAGVKRCHSSNSLSFEPHVGEENDKSSVLAAFFSGSRGTLTNGLEQSRRQLQMYMQQVGNQTNTL